jgi:N-acetylneuraminic acid mutarotase
MARRFAPACFAIWSIAACSSHGFGGPGDAGEPEAGEGPDGEPPDRGSHDVGNGGPNAGSWKALPPMPDPPRFYLGAAGLGDRVVVIGGNLAPESTLAQAFDTKTKTWQTLDALPSPYSMPSVATVGDRLFVLGGFRSQAAIEYDAQGHWVARAQLPLVGGRGAAAVGVWGTKILIAGGILPGQSNNMLNTGVRQVDVVAYDTASDTWQVLAPMTEARGYSMGAVVGDRFWVFGGSTNDARTGAVQSLDLVQNRWTDEPPLDRTLSSAAVVVLADRIYLIGGVASSVGAVTPDTLLYAQSTGTLTPLALMPTPRFASAAAVVGGSIYVAGGTVVASPTDVHATSAFEVFTP